MNFKREAIIMLVWLMLPIVLGLFAGLIAPWLWRLLH